MEELRKKSKQEIQKNLKESQKKLSQLRFDLAIGKVKNIKEVRQIKKDIARMLTILKSSKD